MHALLAELESVALNELKREWNGNGDKWATKVFFCQLEVLYRATKAGLDWFYHMMWQSLLACQTIG